MTNELRKPVYFVEDDGTLISSTEDDIVRFPEMDSRAAVIERLFSTCCSDVKCDPVEDMPDAFELECQFEGEELRFCLGVDGVTPPGNNRSATEYRVQPRGKQIRYVYDRAKEGIETFWLCIYQRNNGVPVYCAWASKYTTSDQSNALYKVDASTIGRAMKYGFAVELRNRNKERVCAFKAEMLPMFLSSREELLFSGATPKNDTLPNFKAVEIGEPRNLIFFGAPGTGKSYELNRLAVGTDDEPGLFKRDNVTRVTFHPDYTYAQFVGCYKPYSPVKQLEDGGTGNRYDDEITYRYIPGPFLETYVRAVQNPAENYLLVIEEINRANPAAVFGDVFQLLDRKEDGTSEYEVAVPVEMRNYLNVFLPEYATTANFSDPKKLLSEQARLKAECERLRLPSNMYIWATMNSADQGVFPMDTAFKRRWDFRYMGIDDGSSVVEQYLVPLAGHSVPVSWDKLRRGINHVLMEAGVNEDKLLGPFFISPSRLKDAERFTDTFQDKVLLYLFEDAAKTKKSEVFKRDGVFTYSQICADFRDKGESAFEWKGDSLFPEETGSEAGQDDAAAGLEG